MLCLRTDLNQLFQLANATPTWVMIADLTKTYVSKEYVDIADALKSPIANPTFTGVPAVPTAAPGTNTTQAASTAFVIAQIPAPVTIPASPIPAGTRMPFAQAAAPTGWTQDVSDSANNRMLRVVSGVGNGIGGTNDPTLNNTVPYHTHGFTTGTVSVDHSHAIGDPSHAHGITAFDAQGGGGNSNAGFSGGPSSVHISGTAGALTGIWTGGMSANHTHSGGTDGGSSQVNWTPRYINMIICAKN